MERNNNIIGAVLAALVAFCASVALHAEDLSTLERHSIPSIELNCAQLGGVVFWNTGKLEGLNIQADYVEFEGSTLHFTNGVKLVGERVGDEIIFEHATLVTKKDSFSCVAE